MWCGPECAAIAWARDRQMQVVTLTPVTGCGVLAQYIMSCHVSLTSVMLKKKTSWSVPRRGARLPRVLAGSHRKELARAKVVSNSEMTETVGSRGSYGHHHCRPLSCYA